MKNFKQQISKVSPISVVLVLVFAATMTYLIVMAFAAKGPASLYTSPGGSQSVNTGETFTVAVRISTAGNVPVTGASVIMNYPTSQLQVVSQSYSGSAYTTQLSSSNSNGVLQMDRAAFPMISGGDKLFATVTFRALSTGTANISFAGNSIITSGEDDSNIISTRNGVSYNISSPTSSNPSNPSGGSNGSSGGSSGTSSGGGGGSTSSSSSSNSTGNTDSGGSSGTSSSSDTNNANSSSDTIATRRDEKGLAANNKTVGSLLISVVDSDNKPVSGANVTIDGKNIKTDDEGKVRFIDVPAGQQSVTVNYNGRETSQTVDVKGTSKQNPEQAYTISIQRDKFNPIILIIPSILLLAVGAFIVLQQQGRLPSSFKNKGGGAAHASKPTASYAFPASVTPATNSTEAKPKSRIPYHTELPGTVYSPTQSGGIKSETSLK